MIDIELEKAANKTKRLESCCMHTHDLLRWCRWYIECTVAGPMLNAWFGYLRNEWGSCHAVLLQGQSLRLRFAWRLGIPPGHNAQLDVKLWKVVGGWSTGLCMCSPCFVLESDQDLSCCSRDEWPRKIK